VDAGQTLEFAPNGIHVMLMGLKKPLVEGQKFELALQFEVAGPRKVKVEVRKP
jgi:copper(I)-binding protein